jgi:hypothetical protein
MTGMSKVKTKMRLLDPLFDPDFPDVSNDSQDARKKYRAVRKRQLRSAELRIRREYAIRKKLGIK